ncbi:unnamed protein product, partial [Vitis vinifera]
MKKQGCEIEAIGINYQIYTHKGEQSSPFKIFNKQVVKGGTLSPGVRHVLKDVNCEAKPWEILAIVGPSGAGKSSLLEILAGKIAPQTASICVNQKPMDKAQFKKISGFVAQKDTLFPLLTVEETLMFSAKLRLRLPPAQLISKPTSGLDSTSALQIIDMLKTMAESRGRTIILSIHQPGFRIVKLFNSILLLANGSVLHHGTVEQLGLNLRLMGLEPPLHVNIVEYAIESGNCTLQQLFQQSKVIDEEIIINTSIDFARGFANSRFRETIILTHRFSKNIFRTKELFACRTLQMLIAGLVLGSIFYQLKDNLIGAEERVGLFAFILTFLLSCTTEALPIFLQERDILMKETSSGSYRVSSYAIANGLVYLPFLLILAILFSLPLYLLVVVVCFSALVPNFIVGYSVISGVMGSFFLFSGYFISKNGMPDYWIFMHYISLFKYPFEGFLINEFSGPGKCLDYMFGTCVVKGEDVLREEGYGEESRWRNVVIMVCFILLYRFISYVILRCRCSQRSLKGVLV